MLNKIIISLLVFICLVGCDGKEQKVEISGRTMGTSYHIVLSDSLSNEHATKEALQKELDDILINVNQQMSTYISDSEISQFNQSKSLEWFPISNDFLTVIKSAQEISQKTNGAFDITVGPLIELWGFGKKVRTDKPSNSQINNIRDRVGYQKLSFRDTPPALKKSNESLFINVSAIAKGFAVDKLSDYLIAKNYKNFMVEIGGELRVSGKSPRGKAWSIAIRNPDLNSTEIQKKMLSLDNQAVATSGNYLNFFIEDKVRYSHILDPRTGQSKTQKAMSITVVNKSTMVADAYATALVVLGVEEGKKLAQQLGLEVYWANITE